jgi:hypothetical protein
MGTDKASLEIIIDMDGPLIFRDGEGRIIIGDEIDGRCGGDWVGATLSDEELPNHETRKST